MALQGVGQGLIAGMHMQLPTSFRPTRRNRARHTSSRHPGPYCAFGPDPFQPLERAIQVINRVLTIGERASRSSSGRNSKQGSPADRRPDGHRNDRWVQFGAVSTAKIALKDIIPLDASINSDETRILLREYLALPVEEYALLDPKWVRRDVPQPDTNGDISDSIPSTRPLSRNGSNNRGSGGTRSALSSFRVSVPLSEVLGIDLVPELSITAHPDPRGGKVTFIGSRAALGSPAFDESFQLRLVAALSGGGVRYRRGLPDHIPGRPVMRLRRWAAKARDITDWTSVSTQSGQGDEQDMKNAGVESTRAATALADREAKTDEEDSERVVKNITGIGIDASSSLAPFPSEQVYMSHDSDDNNEVEYDEESHDDQSATPSASVLLQPTDAAASSTAGLNLAASTGLECRVNITVAVRVPRSLSVVPNPLLGYAGSLIVKTVLNATLPNFLDLLVADFKKWSSGGRSRDPDSSANLGVDLFVPIDIENKGSADRSN